MITDMALIRNWNQELSGARERKRPEKQSGQRKKVAGERRWPEKDSGWRESGWRKKWPEARERNESQHSLLAQTERHVTSFEPFGNFPVTLNREGMALQGKLPSTNLFFTAAQPDSENPQQFFTWSHQCCTNSTAMLLCIPEKRFPSTCNGE